MQLGRQTSRPYDHRADGVELTKGERAVLCFAMAFQEEGVLRC
jgi:hypothetical protein